jgi:hypothetical protein
MNTLTERLRARLITIPKPGSEPFTPGPSGITCWIGGTHVAGDDAGLQYLFQYSTFGPPPPHKVQAHIYAIEPLCAEAADEIERLHEEIKRLTKALVDEDATIERLSKALEFSCPEDPFDGGDLPCHYCGIDPGATHKSNCAWVIWRTSLGYGPFKTL